MGESVLPAPLGKNPDDALNEVSKELDQVFENIQYQGHRYVVLSKDRSLWNRVWNRGEAKGKEANKILEKSFKSLTKAHAILLKESKRRSFKNEADFIKHREKTAVIAHALKSANERVQKAFQGISNSLSPDIGKEVDTLFNTIAEQDKILKALTQKLKVEESSIQAQLESCEQWLKAADEANISIDEHNELIKKKVQDGLKKMLKKLSTLKSEAELNSVSISFERAKNILRKIESEEFSDVSELEMALKEKQAEILNELSHPVLEALEKEDFTLIKKSLLEFEDKIKTFSESGLKAKVLEIKEDLKKKIIALSHKRLNEKKDVIEERLAESPSDLSTLIASLKDKQHQLNKKIEELNKASDDVLKKLLDEFS